MSELVKALAAALPLVEAAAKDKDNPAFRSKYADLSNVIDAIRPVIAHGLWFRQQNVPGDGAAVETLYTHTSGEEKSAGIIDVPVNKKDAQGYGSALTYARRYGLMTAFGIAPEDDDGNAAAQAAPRQKAPPAAPATPALPQVEPAEFLQRWQRMLAQAETLAALEKLKKDTADERAAVKAADPDMSVRVLVAYKARQKQVVAMTAPQAG